jgi:sugar lactone lactonase YvrE
VTLSVSVSGTGPFNYQWQLNGTNLPGSIITTVAGNGISDHKGDGGPAINARLSYPWGVTVDTTGNIFIADTANMCIRKVDTNGIITTVAGNVNLGYSGDGGLATSAELDQPPCVAVDATGNLFIADMDNNVIRKVDTNEVITTVVGNGGAGYTGDGILATNASLFGPRGVAVDASGNLFIADSGDNRIRKVDTNGIITTVAGNGYGAGSWEGGGYSGDGGIATNAELNYPEGVAVDASGNLFIVDNQRIRKVGTNGIITTVAGNGTNGYSGDGGAATNAEFSFPSGVSVDNTGNLFIVDLNNSVIRKFNTNGITSTVAGNGTNGYSGDGGAAIGAKLYWPSGGAVDASGNLFIADTQNQRIRKVTPPSSVFPFSPTLVLNNVGLGNAGAYAVVVSNPYGSLTSSVVNLTVTLPSVILSMPQIAVGQTNFNFQLSGPAGNNYVLQVSTNLFNWSPVSTSAIPASGTITLTNAITNYNRRFYRVHLQ